MAVGGKQETIEFQAQEDLSSYQYHGIAFADGKLSQNGGEASGIILNKPENGEHATVAYFGRIKFKAGGAISAGDPIKGVDSGWFSAGGSGYYNVGRAVYDVTSGSVGTGIFNFATPVYANTSDFAWA